MTFTRISRTFPLLDSIIESNRGKVRDTNTNIVYSVSVSWLVLHWYRVAVGGRGPTSLWADFTSPDTASSMPHMYRCVSMKSGARFP